MTDTKSDKAHELEVEKQRLAHEKEKADLAVHSTPSHSVPSHPTTHTRTKDDKLVAPPKPVLNEIPDGAIDINLVRPGFGPLEGSPKENDPTVLANPNNPLSPITVPQNPSNPANQPNTQSEKPASEVRMHQTLLAKDKDVPVAPEAKKRSDDLEKEKAELYKQVDGRLKAFNGNESDIPPSDTYWSLVSRLRAL